MNVPDEEIVEAVLQGERDLFGVLVSRYQKPVFNLMLRYAEGEEQAADLTQDTFLRAFDQLWKFQKGRRFFPWLYTIGVNLAKDWSRKSINHREQLVQYRIEQVVENEQRQDIHKEKENVDFINNALARLPADDREILILRYRHECSIREVAQVFRISESAAKMRLKRGLARLQESSMKQRNT